MLQTKIYINLHIITIQSKGGGFSYVQLKALKDETTPTKLTHKDIQWKLEAPKDVSLFNCMNINAAAKAIHTECILKGSPIPPILCPKGGKATLATYINGTYIHIHTRLAFFMFEILIHLLLLFF